MIGCTNELNWLASTMKSRIDADDEREQHVAPGLAELFGLADELDAIAERQILARGAHDVHRVAERDRGDVVEGREYSRSNRPMTAGPRISWNFATLSRRISCPAVAQIDLRQVGLLRNSPSLALTRMS